MSIPFSGSAAGSESPFGSKRILRILDRCCENFTFPMLDNGYFYLAASRLSLFRSPLDWALVFERFGFSPRAGFPDTYIETFASKLHERDGRDNYRTPEEYDNYLANNPNNEFRTVWAASEGPWLGDDEMVAENASEVVVRGRTIPLPRAEEYVRHGIDLERSPRVQIFELCRYLAGTAREAVLATPEERRVSVPPEMNQILQLEEWHHPNLIAGELPSKSETFRQLVDVLATGDVTHYRPSRPPNNHWRNWPDGGTL